MTPHLQQYLSGKATGLLLLPLIISLMFAGVSLNRYSPQPVAGLPLGFPISSYETLSLVPFGSAYPYDEQVGMTLTQNFSELAFNVTAVPFTDPQSDPSGVGPGYLVNGLTNAGYWYQVGLAYNWPFTSGPINQGFYMSYEVFDSRGVSVDPSNSGGGLQSFSGTVNAGDVVLLSLRFSSGTVVMRALDWQTGAVSSHSYNAHGSIFIGLQSSVSNRNGFFTGLMTEQYHSSQYYGAGLPVVYSETGASLSSGWMWMDEWNTDTHQSVFSDNTSLPITFDSSLGHYFSSNGTAEVANGHRLVTGLTPVTFPVLGPSVSATGRPGRQVTIPITIGDAEGATVRFENLNVSTSFGNYIFSLGTPFSFGGGSAQYYVSISVPTSVILGDYNLTIDVRSWQYLDEQAQEWIPLQQGALNGTLVLTDNPPPPANQGSNPPPSGQGPSTSTNNTTLSPSSLLGAFRAIIIPIGIGYGALALLAVALLFRQKRKRLVNFPIHGLSLCQGCGMELGAEALTCPRCGLSTAPTGLENPVSTPPNPGEYKT